MPLLTVAETARELSCSPDRIYSLIRQRKIRPYKFGPRSTRLDLDEIKAAAQQESTEQ